MPSSILLTSVLEKMGEEFRGLKESVGRQAQAAEVILYVKWFVRIGSTYVRFAYIRCTQNTTSRTGYAAGQAS